jgi:hypothetical protein
MTQQLVYQGKEKREGKSVVVDRELERIYKKHKVVTVDVVLSEARKESHPLHSYFEWDDQRAAEKYRIVQAYSLIMASKFVVSLVENNEITPKQVKGTAQVRRLVSSFRGEGFKLRTDALKDAESRAAIIEAKKSQLRSWCNSTIDIHELEPLRQTILATLQ